MNDIHLTDVSISYRSRAVISHLNAIFVGDSWHVILGRSGVGKSTLLDAIANILPSDAYLSGTIRNEQGENLNGKITLMAQQNDLLPWLNVQENVVLGARLRKTPRNYEKARELLVSCGLSQEINKSPQSLSGGQRQRVALARTLMEERPIVLMDEPFSALDAVTRFGLQTLASELLREKTVVMITHDPAEALRLADYLYVLDETLTPCELPEGKPPRAIEALDFAQSQKRLLEQLHAH